MYNESIIVAVLHAKWPGNGLVNDNLTAGAYFTVRRWDLCWQVCTFLYESARTFVFCSYSYIVTVNPSLF